MIAFDDVKVHYNSDKPAQLQALAYTQGNQVYIAPGREKHLKHELGHVIQQKQGRVWPTTQRRGLPVNGDPSLEKEADAMRKRGKQRDVPLTQGHIIQLMDNDDEDLGGGGEEPLYERLKAKYVSADLGDAITFEGTVADCDDAEDLHRILWDIIEQDPNLIGGNDFYNIVGIIDNTGMTYAVFEIYGTDIFEFRESIIKRLVKAADTDYTGYKGIFAEFTMPIEATFFGASIANLDAILALGMNALQDILRAQDASRFIENQAVLSPWYSNAARPFTLQVGADDCVWLSGIYTPSEHRNLSQYAARISAANRQVFFTECHNLLLGSNVIGEITASAAPMNLVNRNVAILGTISKTNRFKDWIIVLSNLMDDPAAVTLQNGVAQDLGAIKGVRTYENIIGVINVATGQRIHTFVYHTHPELGIVEGARHLKPERGNSTTFKLDYDDPAFKQNIKNALGI